MGWKHKRPPAPKSRASGRGEAADELSCYTITVRAWQDARKRELQRGRWELRHELGGELFQRGEVVREHRHFASARAFTSRWNGASNVFCVAQSPCGPVNRAVTFTVDDVLSPRTRML